MTVDTIRYYKTIYKTIVVELFILMVKTVMDYNGNWIIEIIPTTPPETMR